MSDEGGIEKIDLEKVDWRGSREFFESLGEALDKIDDKDESYDFTWVGKRKAIIEAGAPINKTFRPDVESSKNWDTTENLFIEGDNLDALKLLQESYLGKVKMIYIDPPYNTGKDFVYHDNFKANVEQYDEDTEYHDDDGNIQFKKNEKTNGRYHSDWLSMMYPRLKLARNLLSDDGVIFISIDDNEQANLKKLCDEIFGEDNFLDAIIWKKTENIKMDSRFLSQNKDYVLCYRKSPSLTEFQKEQSDINRFNLTDDKGKYYLRKLDSKSAAYRPTLDYVIENDGEKFYAGGSEQEWQKRQSGNVGQFAPRWLWSEQKFRQGAAEGEIVFRNSKVYNKVRYDETAKKPFTDMPQLPSGQTAQKELNELLGKRLFDYPKSPQLIKWLANLVSSANDYVVLDFFAGSGSTAHAVMQLNAEDGGSRKWIVVQLPEETGENSEAFNDGYQTIPEISRERIRRAGDKIASEHPDAKVDYGFRALRIDDTNHKDVYRPAADYQQSMLDELVDNVKEDRTDLDLLYGVLTATAWELNKPLETVELAGATVYKYDYFDEVSGLIACFADEISEEVIKQIAQLKPLTAVFKEGSFPNSQAKVNAAEHFRIISPDTKVKVI